MRYDYFQRDIWIFAAKTTDFADFTILRGKIQIFLKPYKPSFFIFEIFTYFCRSGSRGSSFSNSGNDEDSRDNSLTPDAAKLMSELNVLLVPPRSPSRTRKLYERRRSSLETNSLVIPTPKTSKPPRLKMKRSKSPDKSLIPGFVPVKMEQSEMPLSPFRSDRNEKQKNVKENRERSSSKKSGRRKSLT